MNAVSPPYLYERRYVEPQIELLVLDPSSAEGQPARPHCISRYRPTGTRTASGYYEYVLVEESSLR